MCIKVPSSFQFDYAIHYPRGEDYANNGHLSLRIAAPSIAITQGTPYCHHVDAVVYYVLIILAETAGLSI